VAIASATDARGAPVRTIIGDGANICAGASDLEFPLAANRKNVSVALHIIRKACART
jgi:hypothetical protein